MTIQRPASQDYRAGSVGQPLWFLKVKIIDESGLGLPAGEVGELLVRAPFTFSGYEDDPAANRATFADGWLHTGDVGYIDADGYIYLTGRITELINRGGSKIAPGEVDEVFQQHPAVIEAAAFGFPHATLGQDLAVAVVLRDLLLTERELRLFAAERLPFHKVPSRIVIVAELPKTSLGKVQRNALTARYSSKLSR